MSLSHSPNIVSDGLVLYLDGANYKSFNYNTKNLITTNSLPSSTTGHIAAGGNGTVTYDSVNQAVIWERTSYDAWGAYFYNSTFFDKTLDTTKQYTASFEWKIDNLELGAGVYVFEIADGPDLYNVASASVLSNSISIGNGWYRFSYTFTPLNSGTSAYFRILMGSYNTYVSRFWWRKLQLEQSSTRTDYVDGVPLSTWYDLSGNNNNATITGVPVYSPSNSGGVIYNGSTSYSDLADNTYTRFPHNSAWSISLWCKPITQNITYPGFLIKGNSGLSGVLIYYTAAGIYWKHNATDLQITTTELNVTKNICLTYSGSGNINRYVNGVNVGTVGTMSSTESSSVLRLGSGDQLGNVHIYNFAKYNKMLSAAEVLQNYNELKGRYGL